MRSIAKISILHIIQKLAITKILASFIIFPMSTFLVLSLTFSFNAYAGPVPDTGQTGDYTETFGEDSDYTLNPQSYTKLDDQGNALPDTATEWAMVRDNVTGLIWEAKTDDGSIHDKDNQYNWEDAHSVFIQALNEESFGGFSDWRIPEIKELSFIVNCGRYSPAIDISYFPNIQSFYYWSSTTHTIFFDCAWVVNFSLGSVGYYYKSSTYYVWAVRGRH